MGYFIFCLFFGLLIPLTMLIIGIVMIKKPPKKINGLYGYRTSMSMKNQKTWDYAHKICGKVFSCIGAILTIPSACAIIPFYDKDITTQSKVLTIAVVVQLVFLFISIIPVEVALNKKFYKDGTPKIQSQTK